MFLSDDIYIYVDSLELSLNQKQLFWQSRTWELTWNRTWIGNRVRNHTPTNVNRCNYYINCGSKNLQIYR